MTRAKRPRGASATAAFFEDRAPAEAADAQQHEDEQEAELERQQQPPRAKRRKQEKQAAPEELAAASHVDGERRRKRAPPQKLLEPETRSYFENVETLLGDVAANFATDEDRDLFVSNVYREMDGQEGHLATDPDGSRILERLLGVSTAAQARWLLHRMAGDVGFVMTHRNGSHVLQTLLARVPEWLKAADGQGASEPATGETPSLEQLVVNVCTEIAPDALMLTYDAYASHVVRVLLNVLAGRPVETLTRSKNSKRYRQDSQLSTASAFDWLESRKPPTPAFARALLDLTGALLGERTGEELRSTLRDMAANATSSPVLQLLLLVHAGNKPVLTSLLNALLLDNEDTAVAPIKRYDSEFAARGIRDGVCSHLFEIVLQVAPPEVYLGLYVAQFRGQLADLCRDGVANFVVAHLVATSKSAVHADMLLDELMPELPFLLLNNRAGIVHRMAEMCARFPGPRQKRLMQAIARTLNGHLPQHRKMLLHLLLQLRVAPETGEYDEAGQSFVTPLGAQIAGALFLFTATEQVPLALSLMSASAETLAGWCKTLGGSRMIESFLDGKAPAELKLKLVRKLAGHYCELACDKYGSHTLDTCWKHSAIEQKEKIADELAEHEKTLAGDYYGRFALRNCQVQQFRRRKDDWRQREQGRNRKVALFADLFEDDAAAAPATSSGTTTPSTQRERDLMRAMDREYDHHLAILGFPRGVPSRPEPARV